MLGMILAQLEEREIDHSIAFANWKLSIAKQNYTIIEREELAMVYALQKFRHYLLGNKFNFYMDHYALNYMVNKPVMGGRICRCLLFFHAYDF